MKKECTKSDCILHTISLYTQHENDFVVLWSKRHKMNWLHLTCETIRYVQYTKTKINNSDHNDESDRRQIFQNDLFLCIKYNNKITIFMIGYNCLLYL